MTIITGVRVIDYPLSACFHSLISQSSDSPSIISFENNCGTKKASTSAHSFAPPQLSYPLHGLALIVQALWTMAESLIKPDPDAPGASPGVFTDDDIYEDAGDLEFNPDPAFQKLYLARVPRYVWEAWSTLDDDAEIRIGTIRQSQEIGPDGQPQVRPFSQLFRTRY